MSKLKTTYARSRIPLYIQVASALRQRIESGQWQTRKALPVLATLEGTDIAQAGNSLV